MLKASRATFILLLLFAPLAFGSVEPWAFFFLTLLTGAALLFFLGHCLYTERPMYKIPGFIPLFLVAAFLVFQIIPLPGPVLEIISPRSLSFWQKTAGVFSGSAFWPISLDIKGGVYDLSRFFVCVGCYVLSIQLLADGKMFKRTVLVLAFFGGLLALFSIVQSIFRVDRVLWFRSVPANADPFGPYVCRNHYAGLMEMIFPLILALAYAYRPSRQFGTWRERILGLFDDEDFPLFILLCLSAVITALSVFMSLSRGGIFSFSVSLLFFVFVLSMTRRPGRKRGLVPIIVILFCTMIMTVSWFGWEKLDQRFGGLYATVTASSPEARLPILKNGLNMFKDFPLTGAGFGSFQDVFTRYHVVAPYWVVDYAHNDYLQLLVEGGLIGSFLFLMFFAVIFRKTYLGFKKRKEPYAVLLCLGAASGLVAILCHSFMDFNLHINANALYFSFLCAMMVSSANTRFNKHVKGSTYLLSYKKAGKNRSVIAVVIVLWSLLSIFSAGQWAGAHSIGPFKQINITAKTDPAVRDAAEKRAVRASQLDPLEASFRVTSGNAAFAAGNYSKALTAYQKAIVLQPTRSEILQKAGLAAYYANRDIDLADTLMSAGIEFYPAQPVFYGKYAAFLLKTDRKVEARAYIRQGLALNPYQAEMFFDIMRKAKMTPAEMYAALADNAFVWERFAAYVSKTDYSFMQKEILLKAVAAAEREERPLSRIYLFLARLCVRENNYDEAISVLEKGLAKLPDHTGLLYEMALLYEDLQVTYKAADLYERILMINPGHKGARIHLEKLAKK